MINKHSAPFRNAGPQSERSAHCPALDGIRCLAFLGVFLVHACPPQSPLMRWISLGGQGVQVFFVLSGFLIGRILLRERRAEGSLRAKLKVFYARRALRIFPAYYFLLGLIALVPLTHYFVLGPRKDLGWELFYLSNMKIWTLHSWIGVQTPLWTLAVEEQFYLLAPLLILTVPPRALARCLPLVWLLCAAGRVWCASRGMSFYEVLLPAQLDCLTVGLAAALLQTEGAFLGVQAERVLCIGAVCFALYVPLALLGILRPALVPLTNVFAGQWLLSAATGSLLLTLWNGRGGRVRIFLSQAPLVYLGRISYGLYLYHNFCLAVCADGLGLPYHPVLVALLALTLTAAVAAASWRVLEQPVNTLKRFVPYPA